MTTTGGWTVGRSIALELALALHGVSDKMAVSELPEVMASLRLAVPDDWREEWEALIGPLQDSFGIPTYMAWLSDALFIEDYSSATQAMRELDLPTALEAVTERVAQLGVTPDTDLPPPEQLVALIKLTEGALNESFGFSRLAERSSRKGRIGTILPRLLHGGDLHTRFWHLLDRFYYGTYDAWRETRLGDMQSLEDRGTVLLGARESHEQPPALDRLPEQNPLVIISSLREAVESGRVEVLFLVEPLGHFDVVLMLPGLLIVTFAEPGALFEKFGVHAADVASRLKAVADPTRLKILRMIRHLDLDNTEIAAYLQISRPTVSIHARQLREAGLIETHKEGRQAKHAVRAAAVRALFHDLEQFLDLPDD